MLSSRGLSGVSLPFGGIQQEYPELDISALNVAEGLRNRPQWPCHNTRDFLLWRAGQLPRAAEMDGPLVGASEEGLVAQQSTGLPPIGKGRTGKKKGERRREGGRRGLAIV